MVLKRLDEDCLLGAALHPSVRERLSRVRELAHVGVANLYGVERDSSEGDAAGAWLIWEFIPGQTFERYTADGRTPHDLALLARELILTVDSLHMQGIVHGALGGGNIIVAPGGAVRLTHVSPLLYSDPADDSEAVVNLLETALERCLSRARGTARRPRLRQLLADAREQKMPLRVLGARVAALIEARDVSVDARELPGGRRTKERGVRRRALAGALGAALLGVAVAYAVLLHATGGPRLSLPGGALPRSLTGWHLPTQAGQDR